MTPHVGCAGISVQTKRRKGTACPFPLDPCFLTIFQLAIARLPQELREAIVFRCMDDGGLFRGYPRSSLEKLGLKLIAVPLKLVDSSMVQYVNLIVSLHPVAFPSFHSHRHTYTHNLH